MRTLAEAVACVEELGAATVLVDVEPLAATWDSDETALARGVATVAGALGEAPSVRRIVFLTNSRRALDAAAPLPASCRYVARARKPWRVAALRTLPGPLTVLGDQVLTDGLLAWRLRASGSVFLQLDTAAAPWWPRVQRALGRLLAPLFDDGADARWRS